jgi:hypothetical protein
VLCCVVVCCDDFRFVNALGSVSKGIIDIGSEYVEAASGTL